MTKGLGNMLKPLKKKGSSRKRGSGGSVAGSSVAGSVSNASNMSVWSDNNTVGGQQSIAAKTVDSQVTLKISNKNNIDEATNHTAGQTKKESSSKQPWKSFKKFVVGSSSSSSSSSKKGSPTTSNTSSKLSGGGLGSGLKRMLTSSSAAVTSIPSTTTSGGRDAYELDKAIRGRLDGVDTLSLGPVCRPLVLSTTTSSSSEKQQLPRPPSNAAGKHTDSVSKNHNDDRFSTPKKSNKRSDKTLLDHLDPITLSVTGQSDKGCTPKDVVFDMLWSSGSVNEQSELILEGYVPGGSDRWTVKLEDIPKHQDTVVPVKPDPPGPLSISKSRSAKKSSTHNVDLSDADTDNDDDEYADDVMSNGESTAVSTAAMTDDGSPIVPIYQLWDQMWGNEDSPPPLPSHMKGSGGSSDNGADSNDVIVAADTKDEILQLAAALNVPIDLDEETFIIESPDHLRAVHDLTMVPLQGRRFESAMMIFQNLLGGLVASSIGTKMEHLLGVTHHNIGMLYMCQGQFEEAAQSFDYAVTSRMECLPSNHPDIAVSLARQGTAYFALELFDQALKSFYMALDMFPNEDTTRAKLLNSIGVVHAFQRERSEAIKSFTSALEIQRVWLDGPVRRDALVYDASITLENMGKMYLQRGDYDLSYFVYEEASMLQSAAFRQDHNLVLTCEENIARLLAKRGEYEKALELLTISYKSQLDRFGADSAKCIETLGLLGFVDAKLSDFNPSLKHFECISDWQEKNLPASHPSVQTVTETIKNVRDSKGENPTCVMSC